MSDFSNYRTQQLRKPEMHRAMQVVVYGAGLRERRGSVALTQKEAARRLGVDWKIVELMEDDPESVPHELIDKALQLYDRVEARRVAEGRSLPASHPIRAAAELETRRFAKEVSALEQWPNDVHTGSISIHTRVAEEQGEWGVRKHLTEIPVTAKGEAPRAQPGKHTTKERP